MSLQEKKNSSETPEPNLHSLLWQLKQDFEIKSVIRKWKSVNYVVKYEMIYIGFSIGTFRSRYAIPIASSDVSC